jgi:GH15 family glucan-1,4-alpha-glucosidase
MSREERYPPISDYALIGDCHGTALISSSGSIDWCCMPRMDSDACFGRLLDWDIGGYCSIAPVEDCEITRRYLDDSLVLETVFETRGGRARLLDCFAMHPGGRQLPHRQILRIAEGLEGEVAFQTIVAARFDYGELKPWVRKVSGDRFVAIGSNDGLVIWSDAGLELINMHDLRAAFTLEASEKARLSIQFEWPENLDRESDKIPSQGQCDGRMNQTLDWWRSWSSKIAIEGSSRASATRSAVVLKALTYAPTGAIIAAPTTSLPEAPGGERNWDYRYSWIRDSTFTAGSLATLGLSAEADGFRRFIERSAAGSAADLQIMYRVDGDRRITEIELEELEGYRGARPVRIGNDAAQQVQLDVYGELMELAWRWHQRGTVPDADYWRFLSELVDAAARRWVETDHGFWEVRGQPQHFVQSKAMCWVALDRGIRIAEESKLAAPVDEWWAINQEIMAAIETYGYSHDRGVFVRAFGSEELDASLLLLPSMGFIDYKDERMLRTVESIRTDLDEGGLIKRYRADDGLHGTEGTFLACTFWLAECLARQGRVGEAEATYARACATANDLGLFAEEFILDTNEMAGNFPQGLTHLSHISALAALTPKTS